MFFRSKDHELESHLQQNKRFKFFSNLQYQTGLVRLSADFTERACQAIFFYHSNVNEFGRVWYDHANCDLINSGREDHCKSAWKILR